jgi:hypothetical protein
MAHKKGKLLVFRLTKSLITFFPTKWYLLKNIKSEELGVMPME